MWVVVRQFSVVWWCFVFCFGIRVVVECWVVPCECIVLVCGVFVEWRWRVVVVVIVVAPQWTQSLLVPFEWEGDHLHIWPVHRILSLEWVMQYGLLCVQGSLVVNDWRAPPPLPLYSPHLSLQPQHQWSVSMPILNGVQSDHSVQKAHSLPLLSSPMPSLVSPPLCLHLQTNHTLLLVQTLSEESKLFCPATLLLNIGSLCLIKYYEFKSVIDWI